IYGFAIFYVAKKIFKLFWVLFKYKKNAFSGMAIRNSIYSFACAICVLYIVFNIFWGINYNRVGIAEQLYLKVEKYSIEDLKNINFLLTEKINNTKQNIINANDTFISSKIMFDDTGKAYEFLSKKYSFIKYNNKSVKSSLWGWAGNYLGFLGYYNPLTAEAQVNTTVPTFTQPFTTCHEVAHQLGYAKEMEANFVGYLAASNSTNLLFKYSVYTEIFTYANRTLYYADSTSAIQYRKLLLPQVIADFKERRKFNESHTSFIEPIISFLYGKFLEQNQQPMGILSYEEVTSFIISFYKKYRYL
ncbi:MAG: DUF3810 domain-containing protein, partial [Ferruginibacter sp.]